MSQQKDKVKIDFDTPVPKRYSVGIDVDMTAIAGESANYTGDSIDQHRYMEQANEYIAEKEIKQQFENS